MRLQSFGAACTVTGSMHLLTLDGGRRILIDCGLFQGSDERIALDRNSQYPQIDFPLEGINALVITHIHADHVGRLPYLLAAGFKGRSCAVNHQQNCCH